MNLKTISITKGTGRGNTQMSAFDAALLDAHIGNYNLLYLSSVVPPNSDIVIQKPEIKTDEFGHKLFVVMAEKRESKPGVGAWAGIGWVLKDDNSGGMFVEHKGESEEEVVNLIKNSLKDMIKNRGGLGFGEINYEVNGTKCENEPVCALVAAVYQSQSW